MLRALELELDLIADEATAYQKYVSKNPGSTTQQAEARYYDLLSSFTSTMAGVNSETNTAWTKEEHKFVTQILNFRFFPDLELI